jgi:hypothetical protein
LKLIFGDEGEGAILREVGSHYERGRSESLLKFKAIKADAEAIVVGIGQKSVHLKLYVCCSFLPPICFYSLTQYINCLCFLSERPNGATFVVAPESVHVANLHINDIVTFTASEYGPKRIPRNPVITRLRTDTSWEDITDLYLQEQYRMFYIFCFSAC